MKRESTDIPEVFRRAMEEAGWGEGDDGGRNRRPFPRRPGRPWWMNRYVLIIGLILLFLFSLNWIVTTYTEWLWFTELDYQAVWLKRWGVQIASFVVFFLIALAVLLLNWHVARRRAIASSRPGQTQLLALPGINWLINGIALFLAFGFGSAGGSLWEEFLRYYYRVDFGMADPIFSRDISFYLFELPVYQFFQEWLLSLLVMALLGVAGIYAISNLAEIQRGEWRPHQLPPLRRHVALVGALLLGLWSFGYWFEINELLYSPRGVVFGASYVDINASLWILWAQLALMALIALTVAYNIFRLDLRPVLVAGGLWLVMTILVAGLYPGLLQRYVVTPNEIERERPYIEHNIEFTRLAFGLNEIEERPFETVTALEQADLEQNETVLRNVRLWDYRPLRDTYEQLQALRTYYQFGEIDIDRYQFDGETRQVMLAARELDKTQLPSGTWVNRNLVFTHGYGLVMNPVNEITPEGQPEFFIQDLPPASSVPIEITRPEIYYGEMTRDAVFAGSGRQEFNFPQGDQNDYGSYEGDGGVLLDNYLKRLAFSLRLGDVNVLLSDEIDEGTRLQFHRQIQERVRQITPFLYLDRDPYIVVWDGRLVWIQDAYTISRDFPYATPHVPVAERSSFDFSFNYIRNAAKIVIDAYDGTVTYYTAAPEDPIIQSYARAFPGLFRPLEEMPEGLRAHIRYPEGLFLAQAQQYLLYHMTDVRVFYNQEDRWEVPLEITSEGQQQIEPYYVTLPLLGEEESEYLLIQPYTPVRKNNMVAWLAARSDVPHYGELVVYELPKQELVFGPLQIESRIDQEPGISEQLSLWNQRGSNVIRGNLIVVPMGTSFLYVEPIYLRSETSSLPELKRVILASGNRIVMRPTLDEALTALIQAAPTVETLVVEGEVPEEGETAATPVPTTEDETAATPDIVVEEDATVEELIVTANQHFEAAETAQRNGDWTTYGRELQALRQNLEQLMVLTGN